MTGWEFDLLVAIGSLIILLGMALSAGYLLLLRDVRREVAGYPRASMLMCDAHGLLKVGVETIDLPDIPGEDGKPFKMCLYCYHEKSAEMDERIKAAKKGL